MTKYISYFYSFLFFFVFQVHFLTNVAAQGTQVEFGKNRVQFHQDFAEWSEYESANFITYWYGEGRNIGQSAVQIAEYDFEDIQNLLEHRMNDKIEIIVYKDITDLKQSNIGSEESFYNTGGQTKIVGNKMFVYFNGSHQHLRKQIREGIASVYLNAMLFGANLQEIVQNAVLLNLPEWFKQGLVSFVGEEWSTEIDDQMRDVILSKRYEDFDEFAAEQPKLAGHSLWYYINQNYGNSTVSNLLYLTRINRSVESGFLYVLGNSYRSTTDSWALYFNQRYQDEVNILAVPTGEPLVIKNKHELPLSQIKISPNGQKIVYAANEIGKYKVYIQDVNTGEREMIFKGGFRNAFQATDYNYPLLAWNPSGLEVAIVYEKRDVIKLSTYDITTKKITTDVMPNQYQRVYSLDFANPATMVVSATVRGFSDLFLYFTNTRQTQRITNDLFDDLDATVVKVGNKNGILFASNRPDSLLQKYKLDTILPVQNFDIFYYDLEEKSNELVRITNTPFANERQPMAIDTTFFSFLSNETGIFNRRIGYLEDYVHHYDQWVTMKDGDQFSMHIDSSLAKLDSFGIDTVEIRPIIKTKGISYNNTNYNRSIVEQHASPRTQQFIESVFRNGQHEIYLRSIDPNRVVEAASTRYMGLQILNANESSDRDEPADALTEVEWEDNLLKEIISEPLKEEEETKESEQAIDTSKLDIDNYFFQTDFDTEEAPTEVIIEEEKGVVTLQRPVIVEPPIKEERAEIPKFRAARIIPYRLKFRTDFVTTQLDNSLLFGGLDSYAGTPQGFSYPPPGILFKANFKDLFEDYQFEGGIRVPTTFNGAEYFLVFDDKKKRLDKRYALYRKNLRINTDPGGTGFTPQRAETNIILGQYQVRYPLDIFTSLRATGTLRQDRLTQLSTDATSLNAPSNSEQRIGLKVEYVFDNTLDVAINIKNGTRYKVYGEIVKRFDLQILDGASFDFNEGFLGHVGFDARHYQRLLKHSIFAVRAAGAASFGSETILYYLGGVDNWLFPSINTEIPQPVGGNFAYQTLAANLRGFRYNIRNGNSYALINSELRVPVFKYISRRLRNAFLRNFQVVGFFDVGTAWQGLTPFSNENPLNTSIISVPGHPVEVKVNYFRDPIVAGYGFGVRSMLFGYFLRLDYAWGIETRRRTDKGRLYISMGMDF